VNDWDEEDREDTTRAERVELLADGDALIVDLKGYEGPLDVLLTLARNQKVDLTRISILALAEQYLAFIGRARKLKLEVAADYLVMAAWLAYMKSRLLLPAPEEDDEEPSGEEMAEALAFRLRRLEAMREASERLMDRPRLGLDVFRRGMPDGLEVVKTPVYEAALFDLLKAYAAQRARATDSSLVIEATELYSMEDAYQRIASMLGATPEWDTLFRFLPAGLSQTSVRRSALAATFAASLELAREGRLQIRQLEPFGPIYLRATEETG
jgi:segregation and condensation protein A